MYCSNCGKKAGEQDSFCSGCGKKLGIEEVENIEASSDVGMDNLMQPEKNMKEEEGLRGKDSSIKKKLKISKEMLTVLLKIGVIGCTGILIIVWRKYWLYLYSGNVAMGQDLYISIILRILLIAVPMLLVIAPEKKVHKGIAGFLWGYFLISELNEIVYIIMDVMEARERHLMDLADDSYRVGGYETYYQSVLIKFLISVGIVLGYILLLFVKKERKSLQKVLYILLSTIVVCVLYNCFSRQMRFEMMRWGMTEYYMAMQNWFAAIRICLFGMWFCVRKCRDTEEEKCNVKNVEEK